MLINDGFMHHGMQHPSKTAIQFGASPYTYEYVLASVRQVAAAVQSLPSCSHVAEGTVSSNGLESNTLGMHPMYRLRPCIALLIPNRVEFLEIFLGTALAGGVAMVLNPDWPRDRIRRILTRWTPDVLVAEASLLEMLGLNAPYSQAEASCSPVSYLNFQEHEGCQDKTLRYLEMDFSVMAIALDASNNSPVLDYHQWKAHASVLPQERSDSGTTPFYIGFTSGTTGLPKGVIRSHSSWVTSFQSGQVEFGIDDDDHILVPGAFVHSLSLYTAVEALVNGATLHGMPTFTPKAVLQQLTQATITRVVAVPTLLKAIARAASREEMTFPAMRTIISGGSKLSSDLRTQLHTIFPNADILEYYGASELSFITLASSAESVPPSSVGRPFHGVEVSVRRDNGTAAEPGQIGWIGVHSEMVCSGYLDAADGTGFRVEDGWATVGDRGWLDEAGYLYLVGRERDMLICSGINVYPAEIEAVLLTYPGIEEAVVIGLPDDCRGDIICAVMTIDALMIHREFNRPTLVAYLKTQLEPSKCPRQFFIVDHFPLTTSGKINRVELKRQVLERSPRLLAIENWVGCQ
ncbi:MAG: AMP-binding protein [Cyanobacteria bacterium P01_E01_bin.6]